MEERKWYVHMKNPILWAAQLTKSHLRNNISLRDACIILLFGAAILLPYVHQSFDFVYQVHYMSGVLKSFFLLFLVGSALLCMGVVSYRLLGLAILLLTDMVFDLETAFSYESYYALHSFRFEGFISFSKGFTYYEIFCLVITVFNKPILNRINLLIRRGKNRSNIPSGAFCDLHSVFNYLYSEVAVRSLKKTARRLRRNSAKRDEVNV